ncbi:MAG: hypothetical protein HQL70_10115 [Magnetococcales bacterium]|nr:hypothetical protein [Magnetococcales bacterium]
MAIQTTEIKWYKPTIVNDTTANGGSLSANEIPDGVKNNVWPDVPQAERTTGSVKYRKSFIKVENDDDLTLIEPKIFIETHTPGDDSIVLISGTQTDTQAEADDYTRFYGAGDLDANVAALDTTIDVNVEPGNAAAGHEIFQDGDLIRISDQTSVDDTSGNSEFIQLAATSAVSWNGDKATLTFAAGASLANSYLAAETKVSSVIEAANIEASVDTWGESSTSGTYDESTNPPITDHIGTIEQTWIITFSDATNFSCAGDTVGSVGGGSIGGGDFAPNNSDFSKPYFTLSDGTPPWGGTWAASETITFKTHPAATAIWEKRTVPAGADSLSGNKVVVAISGESE